MFLLRIGERTVTQGTANPYHAGSNPVRCSTINLLPPLNRAVEHLTCNEDVVGSIPTGAHLCRDISSLSKHFLWGEGSQSSESCYPDHVSTSSSQVRTVCTGFSSRQPEFRSPCGCQFFI